MGSTTDIIKRMEAWNAERQYLLDCLKVWDAASEAGYSSDEVKAFSFRPEFLTKEQRRENFNHRRGRPAGYKTEPYRQDIWHNCARLTNGDLVPIPIVKRPVKPLDSEEGGD